MSCWIVEKKHIDLMVQAVAEGTRDGALEGRHVNRDRLGQLLVDACVQSVSYRYDEENLPGPTDAYYTKPYRWQSCGYLPTAAELWRAVRCYAYQSNEHPDWEKSKGCALCERVQGALAKKVKALADYLDDLERGVRSPRRWQEAERAPWGFGELEIACCAARADPEGARLFQAAGEGDEANLVFSDWLTERGLVVAPLDKQDVAWMRQRLAC